MPQRPEFIAREAIREAAGIIKAYGLAVVSGDKWAKGLIADSFAAHGVMYRYTDQTTSGYYAQLPALLTSSAVRLLDSERFVRQMASLRRKLGSQGQDTIAHPTKAHDDLATAATVALVLVRAPGVPQTEEEEEAARPVGSYERPVIEAGTRWERLILERFPADGASRIAYAHSMAEDDPEVLAEYLLENLPDVQRMERGRRSAGL